MEPSTQTRSDPFAEGTAAFERWRDGLLADPAFREISEEEAVKSELWMQLVEARRAAGLTQVQLAERLGVSQAQVARIEKRGYDGYTLNHCSVTSRHSAQGSPWTSESVIPKSRHGLLSLRPRTDGLA